MVREDLILAEQLGRRATAGLFLEINIRELLPVAVPHDEASVVELFNRGGKRRSLTDGT